MITASRINRIENGRLGYENTGFNLEQEFLGTVRPSKYNELAYNFLHKDKALEIATTANQDEKFEKILSLREAAQAEFNNTLAIASGKNYIGFQDSMSLVEKCQEGDPENPSHFFSKALYAYIKERFMDKYTLKFFTAVGGTHLDVVHKIDFYFKLYLKETGQELTYATIDITGRKSKTAAKANVLINIDPEEKDKYDPSPVNKNFDKEFFDNKIAEFGEEIIKEMIENYNR